MTSALGASWPALTLPHLAAGGCGRACLLQALVRGSASPLHAPPPLASKQGARGLGTGEGPRDQLKVWGKQG